MSTEKYILIVEDEMTHINLFKRSIQRNENLSAVVDVAMDGEHGIQKLDAYFEQDDVADLLLVLDLNMPIKNGFEVMEHINQQSYREHIHLVVLTTSDEHEDMQRAKDLGINDYMVKPINYKAFARVIEAM